MRKSEIHARFLLLSLAAGFNFNAFFLYIRVGAGLPRRAPAARAAGVRVALPALHPRDHGRAHICRARRRAGTAPRRVKRAYAFMARGGRESRLCLRDAAVDSLGGRADHVYGIGFAMAIAIDLLITLDLFPTRRGMAASLQGFVSGMVNTLTAGIIAPAPSTTPVGSRSAWPRCSPEGSRAGSRTCAWPGARRAEPEPINEA